MRSDVCFVCALRVSTCDRSVWYRVTWCTWHQEWCGYALYESLLTYVAHMDLVGDPLQGTCHARASEILITKMRKILYLGFRRIWILAPSLIWVAVRSGDDRQVRHRLLQRLALARRAIIRISFPTIPWPMTNVRIVRIDGWREQLIIHQTHSPWWCRLLLHRHGDGESSHQQKELPWNHMPQKTGIKKSRSRFELCSNAHDGGWWVVTANYPAIKW